MPATGRRCPRRTTIEIADVGAAAAESGGDRGSRRRRRIVATIRNSGARRGRPGAQLAIDNRPAADATVPVGPNQLADVAFAGAPRGARPAAVRSTTERHPGRQHPLRGPRRREPSLGAGRDGERAISAATRSTCSRRWPPATAPGTAFQVVGVGRGAAVLVGAGAADGARRGRAAVDARPRSARPRAAGGVRAKRRRHAAGRRTGHRRRRRRRRARRRIARCGSCRRRHEAGRPRAGAGRRPPSGVPRVGRRTRRRSAGPVPHASRSAAAGCQTLARFTTGETALLDCPSGEGRALVLASDLDNRWNDFPLHATFVPFLHEAVRYLASARAHASRVSGRRRAGRGPAGARHRDAPADRRRGGRRARSPSTSIRAKRIRRGFGRGLSSRR